MASDVNGYDEGYRENLLRNQEYSERGRCTLNVSQKVGRVANP